MATAKEPFDKNPDMLIKFDDISCFMANWKDKASNIRQIAHELNIGLDSLVFCDDNPAEREIVKNFVPEVFVVDMPDDPALYAKALDNSQQFDWVQLSKEDLNRSDSYTSNRERNALQSNFVDYGEYLSALEMSATIGEIEDNQVERFTQLTNKSNQFNLRTERYSEADIEAFRQDPNTKCLFVHLKDKFSDYGLINCVVIKKQDNSLFIDNYLMSCRVLKRGIEDLMINYIVAKAKEWGCNEIISEYIPSPKNMMVKDFYEKMGFGLVKTNENGTKYYTLKNLESYIKKEIYIKLNI
jgi:FkbH-like protein